jgi:AraC-like DNA-binding protein
MSPHHQLSGRLARRLLVLCDRLDVDGRALCARRGLAPERLEVPTARVPLSSVLDVIEDLLAYDRHPALGLELARSGEPDAYHTPALIMLASECLREGFRRAFAYQRLWGDGDRFAFADAAELGRDEAGFAVTFRVPGPRRPACAVLEVCALAETMLAVRSLTNHSSDVPRALGLPSCSDDLVAVRDYFRVAPELGQAPAFVILSERVVSQPLPNANALFLSIFIRQAQKELEGLPPEDQLIHEIRAEILRMLAAGNSSLERCARAMSLTSRNLARRLADHSTSYSELVDEVRKEQAIRLLREQRPIDEVALLLGYSERSAFHRACVRWFRTTPAGLRRLGQERPGDS